MPQGVSAPDLLELDLDYCFVIASYLPPSGSNWHSWMETDPELRLQEALAYCVASRDKMLLLLGDLNARTASNIPLFHAPTASHLMLARILEGISYCSGALHFGCWS
jgi:hypothetical protein